jgi:hypothetical protein
MYFLMSKIWVETFCGGHLGSVDAALRLCPIFAFTIEPGEN